MFLHGAQLVLTNEYIDFVICRSKVVELKEAMFGSKVMVTCRTAVISIQG